MGAPGVRSGLIDLFPKDKNRKRKSAASVSSSGFGNNRLQAHGVMSPCEHKRFVFMSYTYVYIVLMLKPVFDLHIGHILKMLDIVGYNGQSFCKGVGCNDHIKLINRLAYLSERVLDSTIYLTMSVKGKYCESFCQFSRPPKEWLSRNMSFSSSAFGSPS